MCFRRDNNIHLLPNAQQWTVKPDMMRTILRKLFTQKSQLCTLHNTIKSINSKNSHDFNWTIYNTVRWCCISALKLYKLQIFLVLSASFTDHSFWRYNQTWLRAKCTIVNVDVPNYRVQQTIQFILS